MKCNHCDAELEEGVTLCAQCGYDNTPSELAPEEAVEEAVETVEAVEETPEAETAAEETEETEIKEGKLTPGKIALLVVLAVAAVAVVIALIVGGMNGNAEATDPTGESTGAVEGTIPADGNPDDVTCKGSYTVTDEEMAAEADTVVATAGDEELTNAQLQIHYYTQLYGFLNEYGSYASYFGLDYTLPLDTQLSADGTTTWQQYFLQSALDAWYTYAAMDQEAKAVGFEMDASYAEELANIPTDLENTAVSYGYADVTEMIKEQMGPGADLESYTDYISMYYNAMLYFEELISVIEVTDQEAEAYFDENAEAYAEQGIEKVDETLVDVRHILIMPEGGTVDETTGLTTYTDEEWEACRVKAQAVLDEFLAGDGTEESFSQLAVTHSEDGNASQGGIYEGVYEGQMVEAFENWCFDESRQYGDSGLVQTEYGYHVMYFVKSYINPEPTWLATAKAEMIDNETYEITESVMAKYELNVDYSKIALGLVEMGVTEE